MSISLNTASMTLHVDYYDPDKGDRRYSTRVMQPVDYSIDIPRDLPNRNEILNLLNSSRDNGEAVEIDYITGTNRYKQPEMTIFNARRVKPLMNNAPKP